MTILLLFVLCAVALGVPAAPTGHAALSNSLAATLSDNFTRDSQLNASLWEISGPVGTAFGSDNCAACSFVQLDPGFSSAGMEIAQVNESNEIGTIESLASFAPPLTVNALVEGVVSNGHPFVFGISSANASSGVQITGNLNPDDCSNETNCGNRATCGIPANASIPPNQCYYGIYARIGAGNGTWSKTSRLNLTPSVRLLYALTISVDASGLAQYSISQGGQVLGESTDSVGTGPFYLILAQSEGAPVPGHGPNQAYWVSVSLTPSATVTPPSSSGAPSNNWLLIGLVVAVVAVAIIVLLAVRRRRRELTVIVLDAESLAPVPGAGVSANGPANLSGRTGPDGKVAFGGVTAGDYLIQAGASGYRPSAPVSVSVSTTAQQAVRIDRVAPRTIPPAPGRPPPSPGGAVQPVQPAPPGAPPAEPQPEAASAPSGPPAIEGAEGWAGGRIREIIETFQRKGALSPETALTAEELGLSRMFVRVMRRRRGKTRVFVEVNGRYYLDQSALRNLK